MTTDPSGKQKFHNVTVRSDGRTYIFSCPHGSSLFEQLIINSINTDAPCGGKGSCGKCAVRVIKGNIGVSVSDRHLLSPDDLRKGIRLSCSAKVESDLEIEILFPEKQDFISLTADTEDIPVPSEGDLSIAVDIGTTTIAMCLMLKDSPRPLRAFSCVNSQRVFGTDVMSRVEASINGKKDELSSLIRSDIRRGIDSLLSDNDIPVKRLKTVCIAGNTTMLHLLMGYDTRGLGAFPFTPFSLSFEDRPLSEILSSQERPADEYKDVRVLILPGNSAFIGADIISGLYNLGFHDNERICGFIDLGTNGEMALGNKDKLLVASAAAGPAFEGGNISRGTGSVPSAISSVDIRDKKVVIKTIGNKEPPSGICGSGVIETVSSLISSGLMDASGLLSDEFFEEGFPLAKTGSGEMITFTQGDIRELQLAKSAIRAAFETLLIKYGITYKEIDTLYIAGGFGYFLDIKKACRIGMIPEGLMEKCVPAGNTSLTGCMKYIKEGESALDHLNFLSDLCSEVSLSTDGVFNDLYLKYMDFDR